MINKLIKNIINMLKNYKHVATLNFIELQWLLFWFWSSTTSVLASVKMSTRSLRKNCLNLSQFVLTLWGIFSNHSNFNTMSTSQSRCHGQTFKICSPLLCCQLSCYCCCNLPPHFHLQQHPSVLHMMTSQQVGLIYNDSSLLLFCTWHCKFSNLFQDLIKLSMFIMSTSMHV